jgi:hypothetical protein
LGYHIQEILFSLILEMTLMGSALGIMVGVTIRIGKKGLERHRELKHLEVHSVLKV